MANAKTKDSVLHTRLSRDESMAFRTFCEDNGLTSSEVLRRLACEAAGFGPTYDGDMRDAILEYARQLKAIGVNINPIARILNSGRTPDDATLRAGILRLSCELVTQGEDYISLCARSPARGSGRRNVSASIMADRFEYLFEGLEGLTFRRRALRQAAIDAHLVQQGVFDALAQRKSKAKRTVKAGSPSGKPQTGVAVKTGARPIDTSLEDEWKKRKPAKAGGAGGSTALHSKRFGTGSPHSAPSTLPAKTVSPAKTPAELTAARVKIASGSQAAVVKIASYVSGKSSVGKLVSYQSREGRLQLEREDGSRIEGAHALSELTSELTGDEPTREPSKDVLRLVITIEGEQYRGQGGSIERALMSALPGHRFAWASDDRADGTTQVEVVLSAAAHKRQDTGKAARIFDNRKSLGALSATLESAFETDSSVDVRAFGHGVEDTIKFFTQLTEGGSRQVRSMRINRDGSFSLPVTIGGLSNRVHALNDWTKRQRETAADDSHQPVRAKSAFDGNPAHIAEAKAWKHDLRSREQRDVAHIILSAKPGTDKDSFLDAARAMLAKEFAGHKYIFTLHEDKEHVHVHAVVKMKSEYGERIDPYIRDFQRWRETLAHEARERHIPRDASNRFERSNPPAYKLKDIRRVERGVASDNVRRRVDAVLSKKPHIPTREEGSKRANEVLQGWRAVEVIAASRTFEPSLADGATRLYRADRPGAASSAKASLTNQPLFTRDRAAATRMAERSGGSVSYIDVSPAELAALKPSRTDVLNQFVVTPELAAHRKPLDQPSTATILAFRNRAEQAVSGAAEREASRPSGPRLAQTTGVNIYMPNLETMQSAFNDINEQMNIVEKALPPELWPQVETVRKKMGETQRDMLSSQQNIERKRGAVQGGRYVEPVPADLDKFISEKRGEAIRYSHLKEDGEIGKIAFVDNGKKVEIHDWNNRDAVLAAMQLSSEKWVNLTVTGTEKYKALVVELAAQHGFQIANPEMQGQLARETARLQRMKQARPGFTAGSPEKAEIPPQAAAAPLPSVPEVTAEVKASSLTEMLKPQLSVFTDTGALVKINDRTDRQAVRAAMEEALRKWGEISVTGTARDKDQAVSVAAEYGYKLANPELQEKRAREIARFEREREKEAARIARETAKAPGFIDPGIARNQGIEAWDKVMKASAAQMDAISTTPAQWQAAELAYGAALSQAAQFAPAGNAFLIEKAGQEKALKDEIDKQSAREAKKTAELTKPLRTEGEITIAPETVRTRVENEASLETRQANTSSATNEKPFDGGGEDHAYRTQAEAGAATRASNAVEMDPKRQMPTDVNQSLQVESMAQDQAELLKQRQEIERGQTQKSIHCQKQ